jgi:hypothetical protein
MNSFFFVVSLLVFLIFENFLVDGTCRSPVTVIRVEVDELIVKPQELVDAFLTDEASHTSKQTLLINNGIQFLEDYVSY